MSNSINKVFVGGHLGADPEMRLTPSGVAVMRMRLATNDAYFDASNKLIERTDWHDVALFGARAEGLSRFLKKGDAVVVEGVLRSSVYERDGKKTKRVEILAREVMLNGKKRVGPAVAAPPAPPAIPFEEEEPYSSETADELAPTGEQPLAANA
jgi:single-strand DNA-binding protein